MERRALIRALSIAVIAWRSAPQSLAAQPTTTGRVMTATRVSANDVQLDGRLSEPVWSRAEPATGFLQLDPDNGAPASEPTEVRAVFDAHRLVLGVSCVDSQPSHLLANQMQRDQSLAADDRFMVSIDPYSDGRTGYFFEINPSGAMGDGLIVPGAGGGGQSFNNVNRSWDGIWTAKVVRTASGWTAEIEIPFRTLYFDPHADGWGINFQRTVRRKNEESLWSGHARNQGLTQMAAAGRITGLGGLSQGIGLDVRPYVAATSLGAPGRGVEGVTNRATYGGDVFYNVTPNLRVNMTVNTDFAETEVDQRQVNLTRFPLFFPEKRTFFLEGSNFFDFSREPGNAIVPFFSRRIGLDEAGVPQAIDYGLKMTGQAGAFDLGVLQTQTRETAAVPGERFTVLRTRRRILSQSYIGAIYTRRAGSTAPDRQTAGVDFALSTTHFRGAQVLELSGFWLTTASGAGTRGAAYGLRLNYPNDPLNLRLAISNVESAYDPAVGFADRRAYRRVNPGARFIRHTTSNRILRRYSFEADVDMRFDPEGRLETRRPDLQLLRLDLQSGDLFEVHLFPWFERLPQDFQIFTDVTLPAGSRYAFVRRQYRAQTANRRPLALNAQYEDGTFYSGERRQVTTTVSLRPRAGWLFALTRDTNDVRLGEGRFTTTLWRADVNTQFSPWLSLVETVQYDTVTRALGWQARFRWIQKPGDDWYVVYTHNWINGETLSTLDRKAAAKIVKTFRF